MIKKSHHIGFVVTDMDQCILFWRDLLGLKQTADFTMNGSFLDTVQGKEGMDYRIVKFETKDGFVIELLYDRGHETAPQVQNSLQAAGLRHFALEVDDVDAYYKRFEDAGMATISRPATSGDGSMRLFFVRDPELNLIEIMQLK
jgi:catechol 2,3-dioxygenase-like lactoylglutathione lyase family enzyme